MKPADHFAWTALGGTLGLLIPTLLTLAMGNRVNPDLSLELLGFVIVMAAAAAWADARRNPKPPE